MMQKIDYFNNNKCIMLFFVYPDYCVSQLKQELR